MEMEEIRRRIIDILNDEFQTTGVELSDETNLTDDLDFDDLDFVELAIFVEDEFNILFPDEDVDNWHTLGDVVKNTARLIEE